MGSSVSSLLPFAHQRHHQGKQQKLAYHAFVKNTLIEHRDSDDSDEDSSKDCSIEMGIRQIIYQKPATAAAASSSLVAASAAATTTTIDAGIPTDAELRARWEKLNPNLDHHQQLRSYMRLSEDIHVGPVERGQEPELLKARIVEVNNNNNNSRRAERQERALISPNSNALAWPAQQASNCDESAAAVTAAAAAPVKVPASSTEIKQQAAQNQQQQQQQRQRRQRRQKNKDQNKTITNTQATGSAAQSVMQIKTKQTNNNNNNNNNSSSTARSLLRNTRNSCTLTLHQTTSSSSNSIDQNNFHQQFTSSSSKSASLAHTKRYAADLNSTSSKLELDKRMTILPNTSAKRSHHQQQPHHSHHHQATNCQARSLRSIKQSRAQQGKRQPNRSQCSSTLSSCSSSGSSSAGSCCGGGEYRDELVAQNATKFTLDPRFRLPPTQHAWMAYAASLPVSPKDHPDSYPQPPPRPWILKRNLNEPAKLQHRYVAPNHYQQQLALEFTALSYNILSDRMVNQTHFPTSSEMALNWFYRRELILRQLLQYDADIISLQELEQEAYDDFFKPQLEYYGKYASIFEPKSRARTMNNHQRRRVDGCAIFYKADKFTLIQRHLLEFNQIAMANAHGSEAMLNRVMTKDNIGLVAVLELTQPQQQPPQRLLVCNTHIHWDPQYCDVKLIQTIMLMNELECIAKQNNNTNTCKSSGASLISSDQLDNQNSTINNNNNFTHELLLPLLLMGDFNSTPNSGVTSYLTKGQIDSLHEDFQNFKYTTCSNSLAASYHHLQQLSNNTTDNNTALRRQSSPAWYYYNQSNQQHSSTTPSPGSSPVSSCTSFASAEEQTPVLNYNHPFKMSSSYENNIMPYTNFTTTFKAVIDYIFYSQDSIQLLGLLGPLDKHWVKRNRIKTFPHAHLPSDHLPLLAKFRFITKSSVNQTKSIKKIHL